MTTEQCCNNIVIMAEQHYHWQRCSRWPCEFCSCWTPQTLFMRASLNLFIQPSLKLFMLVSSTLFILASSTLSMLTSLTLFMMGSSTLFTLAILTLFMLTSSTLFMLASSTLIMLASSMFFKSVNRSLPWMMCVFACVHEKYNSLYTHAQEILRLNANGNISTYIHESVDKMKLRTWLSGCQIQRCTKGWRKHFVARQSVAKYIQFVAGKLFPAGKIFLHILYYSPCSQR